LQNDDCPSNKLAAFATANPMSTQYAAAPDLLHFKVKISTPVIMQWETFKPMLIYLKPFWFQVESSYGTDGRTDGQLGQDP